MSPNLGIIASSISGHLYTITGNYDALSTVTVPSGGLSSITFAGIPTTGYSHLQVRVSAALVSGNQLCRMELNSDTTTTNYYTHALEGDGSTAYAYSGNIFPYVFAAAGGTTYFSGAVIDILEYANTNKYKTIRSLYGYDANGSGGVSLFSGLWKNTNATTTIKIYPNYGANFSEYSSFALYGVK